MKVLEAYKYRLLPTPEQLELIKKTAGCSRSVFNCLLERMTTQLNNKEKIKIPKITELYSDKPYLKEVDSLALANARVNFQNATSNFFKSKNGLIKGKRRGFPKFKKKGVSKDSYTTNNQKDSIRIEGNTIKLPKLGFVNLIIHRPLIGEIRSTTITINKTGTVDVSILTLVEKKQIKKQTKTIKHIDEIKKIGLDMSMSELYVGKDEERSNFQRHYRNSEKKRRRLKKKISRKKLIETGDKFFSKKWKKEVEMVKPSKNREKAKRKLAKFEAHTANSRKDFAHKKSRYFVNNYDVITLEDINMQDMARCLNLGKSVGDLGFGMFRTFLEYKSIVADTLVVRVPKWFPSSKLCSDCDYKYTELKLSEREWACPGCGVIHDRDENASYNLNNYFIKEFINTVGTTGFQACGDGTSGLRETLIKVLSLKQEGNIVRFVNRRPSL